MPKKVSPQPPSPQQFGDEETIPMISQPFPPRHRTMLSRPTRSDNPFPAITKKKKKTRTPCLKRKRPKRTLKGNENIAEMINKQIDIMESKFPYYSMVKVCRSALTGQSCVPKKHFEEKMETHHILINQETNYGTIVAKSIPWVSDRNSYIREALDNMGILESDIIQEELRKQRSFLQVDTSALKMSRPALMKTDELLEELQSVIDCCDIDEDDGTKNIIRYITSRIYLMKKIWDQSREYLSAYNRCKDIFERASTIGSFPRLYMHKGVCLGWADITEKSTLKGNVTNYFNDYDEKYNTKLHSQFRAELKKISAKYNKRRLLYTLDGYDYIEDD